MDPKTWAMLRNALRVTRRFVKWFFIAWLVHLTIETLRSGPSIKLEIDRSTRDATGTGRCVLDPTDTGCKERINIVRYGATYAVFEHFAEHVEKDGLWFGSKILIGFGLWAPGTMLGYWIPKLLETVVALIWNAANLALASLSVVALLAIYYIMFYRPNQRREQDMFKTLQRQAKAVTAISSSSTSSGMIEAPVSGLLEAPRSTSEPVQSFDSFQFRMPPDPSPRRRGERIDLSMTAPASWIASQRPVQTFSDTVPGHGATVGYRRRDELLV